MSCSILLPLPLPLPLLPVQLLVHHLTAPADPPHSLLQVQPAYTTTSGTQLAGQSRGHFTFPNLYDHHWSAAETRDLRPLRSQV